MGVGGVVSEGVVWFNTVLSMANVRQASTVLVLVPRIGWWPFYRQFLFFFIFSGIVFHTA